MHIGTHQIRNAEWKEHIITNLFNVFTYEQLVMETGNLFNKDRVMCECNMSVHHDLSEMYMYCLSC